MSCLFCLILLQSDDLFRVSIDGDVIEGPPAAKKLKQSQCTPLFMNAYKMRGLLVVTTTFNLRRFRFKVIPDSVLQNESR